MQKIIPILMLAVFATVLISGQAAFASNKSTFNITVNCLNGAQVKKQEHSTVLNNVNINVNCSGGGSGTQGPKGDTGATGAPGKNGQNATVTIVTTSNQTFATKNFNCQSVVAMLPFACQHK